MFRNQPLYNLPLYKRKTPVFLTSFVGSATFPVNRPTDSSLLIKGRMWREIESGKQERTEIKGIREIIFFGWDAWWIKIGGKTSKS